MNYKQAWQFIRIIIINYQNQMIKDQESHGLTYNKDYNESKTYSTIVTIRLFRKKLEKEYGA